MQLPKDGDFLSYFPLELRGFVIAAILVVGGALIFRTLRAINAPLRVPGKNRSRTASPKEKAAARDAALAAGFMVDDVARDMPEKGGSFLKQGTCGRYQWPERAQSNADVELLCRPDEQNTGFPTGRRLRVNDGVPSAQLVQYFHDIAGRVPGFLEIEIADHTLYFYWDEIGGSKTVAQLKTFAEKLRDIP